MDSRLSRFEEKVYKDPISGCWIWSAALSRDGYGLFRAEGKATLAHRFSWSAFRGALKPYPQYELDHKCRIRCCVNPWHLDEVEHQENVRRGDAKFVAKMCNGSKTHCKRGHEYTEENTYLFARKHGIQRQCRKCRYEANKKRAS